MTTTRRDVMAMTLVEARADIARALLSGPVPEPRTPATEHQTHTWLAEVDDLYSVNGKGRFVVNQRSGWSCTCGTSGFEASRERARDVARTHRRSVA